MDFTAKVIHHGAVNGVTGSCHQLVINSATSILVDCGLFQGAEVAGKSAAAGLTIDFDISHITALIVTHCHIDHVGRIPYLLAAGFTGPIFCTEASASLLPLVIEDALKVGVTRDRALIAACLKLLNQQIKPIAYKQWFKLPVNTSLSLAANHANSPLGYQQAKAKFQPAGHILGSAYVEVDLAMPFPSVIPSVISAAVVAENSAEQPLGKQLTSSHRKRSTDKHRVVFSGDLGAPYAPLLPAPKSPYRADTLIIESTYGDKNHQSRKLRRQSLQRVIEQAVADNGVVLIPAFSIGRTQELLYELEQIIHQQCSAAHANKSVWQSIEVIVDSPMAANFTEQYKKFKGLWDAEAKHKVSQGRHPLNFSQLYTIGEHKQHLSVVKALAKRNKPAIVIAASGMCAGGRIMNYLKQFITDKTTDILFVGYQAQGTPGRDIQQFANRANGYVVLDDKRYVINAAVHTVSGYSAHADQADLINFVKRMRHKPRHIKIVHGDEVAKAALQRCYQAMLPEAFVEIAE
ncbi:MBL fold metallo-hydrolase RNA specificity domain-containing protein [Colwellia sp. C1TZA3]|uniref:MBL fold metallo-hydrolase RNA specificity domain-containing protein n=1 Tax=Colwellia sp. C1TZA3 TaxID=2508879 RepID=UPI0011B9B89A|nr:MBL fold metallo-hydrolase [Colwellia sp. C1TZA3]TWX72964.1 MBL fold metallo-hydrolase [Colwellia sp. C1TZA3]